MSSSRLARALGVPGGEVAGMTATAKRDKFKQFAAAHALRGDAVNVRTKPTDRGLLVSVSCSCGASAVDTLTRRECAEFLTLLALEKDDLDSGQRRAVQDVPPPICGSSQETASK